MDPVSAAGIGLGAMSLLFQVFAGCVKGYQLFLDAQGMPATIQHLRIRLRLEQTRFLNFGQRAGLVEELLDKPTRALQANRNVLMDVFLDIQAIFKDCVVIQEKYESFVPSGSAALTGREERFERRFPRGTDTILRKTLGFLEKAPQVPRRLEWALVKQDRFEGLIQKLIGYNGSVESLLGADAIDYLRMTQHQTVLAMLQLNSNMAELKEMSLAMRMEMKSVLPGSVPRWVSNALTETAVSPGAYGDIASLADFKARGLLLEYDPATAESEPVDRSEVSLLSLGTERAEAVYKGKNVWVEWKEYDVDDHRHPNWNQTISSRVKKLAILLGLPDKPKQFGTPYCLGYFNDEITNFHRYGFLYAKPKNIPPNTEPVSLLALITTAEKPSLTKRIALAHTIARCLLYLHSVNWLHKGLRSDSIVFFYPPDQKPDLTAPIISRFDYARPDAPDEMTEPVPQYSAYDVYRHPVVIGGTVSRSQKSHDIYSLGVVLVEIAYWQRIDAIMEIPTGDKAARSRVRKVRGMLLGGGNYMDAIEGNAGAMYREAVQTCLAGGHALDIPENANEADVEVGACIQTAFSEKVVRKLTAIRL